MSISMVAAAAPPFAPSAWMFAVKVSGALAACRASTRGRASSSRAGTITTVLKRIGAPFVGSGLIFVAGSGPSHSLDSNRRIRHVRCLRREGNRGACPADDLDDGEEQLLLDFHEMVPIPRLQVCDDVDVEGRRTEAEEPDAHRGDVDQRMLRQQ